MGAMAQTTTLTIVYSTVYLMCGSKKTKNKAARHWHEFPAQMTSNAENVSIWWRNHEMTI